MISAELTSRTHAARQSLACVTFNTVLQPVRSTMMVCGVRCSRTKRATVSSYFALRLVYYSVSLVDNLHNTRVTL